MLALDVAEGRLWEEREKKGSAFWHFHGRPSLSLYQGFMGRLLS